MNTKSLADLADEVERIADMNGYLDSNPIRQLLQAVNKTLDDIEAAQIEADNAGTEIQNAYEHKGDNEYLSECLGCAEDHAGNAAHILTKILNPDYK